MSFIGNLRDDILGKKLSKDKAKAIQDLFMLFLNQQRPYRIMWMRCSAFMRGIHYSAMSDDGSRLITPKLPYGMKMSKDNQMGAWKRQMMARINVPEPRFEVTPNDMSIEEIIKSQTGTAFLDHLAVVNKWTRLRYKMSNYLLDFGNAFGYVRDFENPNMLYPRKVLDVTGEPVLDPETGREKVNFENVVDVQWDILKPHNVFCSLDDSYLSEKNEVILAFSRDLDYVERKYNFKATPRQDATSTLANYDIDLLSKGKGVSHELQKVNELIYLRKPTTFDKKGNLKIVINEEVVEDKDWPYEYCGELPLVHMIANEPPPGEFYALPPGEDQIPLQRDINESLSIVQENIANVGHKKWAVPIGSDIKSINDISGEIIYYNPEVGPPSQIEVKPLPHYEVNQINVLRKELSDVQHHHSVSRGDSDSSVRSEVGLNRLAEEDNTPLGTIDDFIAFALADMARISLKIGAEKMDVPQVIKYIGEGRRRVIKKFTGDMLDPNSDVQVRLVNKQLRNKTAAQNMILELARHGLITDKFGNIDRQRIQKAVEFAVPEKLYDIEDKQREMAYDENELMMEGEVVEAKEYEYQFVHLEVVEELLNSREYKERIKEDSKLQEIVEGHWTMHRQLLAEALAPIMQQQEQTNSQATPGEGS